LIGIPELLHEMCAESKEDGKTELSLVHFTLMNPEWQPPTDAEDFVAALWTQARKDVNQLMGTTGVGAGVCVVHVCGA
jgi:hypothetical protein